MIKRVLGVCCAFFLGFSPTSVALAGDSLSETLVQAYVSSLSVMQARLHGLVRDDQFWQDPDMSMHVAIEQVGKSSDAQAYRQLDRQARDFGFDGVEQWALVADQVQLTRQYIQDAQAIDKLYSELDTIQLELAQNTRQYSTAELEQVLKSFEHSKQIVLELVATRELVPLVRPYLAELDAAMENE